MVIAQHGGDTFSREIRYDFSSNLNPLGMPRRVKEALQSAVLEWERYPDPFCRTLREKLSKKEQLPMEQIVCGNGAADLIYRIVAAIRPKRALVCAPAFSEYETALQEFGCAVERHLLREETGFALTADILSSLHKPIELVFLCNPNNPVGNVIQPEVLHAISQRCHQEGIFLICDECFLDFVEDGAQFSGRQWFGEQMILLKAFTKSYAMAGLRLGYGLFGSKSIAEQVANTGQYWSVSAPAQLAGTVALEESEYLQKTVPLVAKERLYLTSELTKLGCTVYHSDCNFLLFHHPMPLEELLLSEQILIRNCGNYHGLSEGFFRIAVRTHKENTALLAAMRRVIYG